MEMGFGWVSGSGEMGSDLCAVKEDWDLRL